MNLTRLLLLLALCAGLSGPAVAARTTEQGYYRLAWNGITIGRIRFEATTGPYGYAATLDSKSKGIANLFNSFKNVTGVEGQMRDGVPLPRIYKRRDDKGGDCPDCHIRMMYDNDGVIAAREVVPPDDPAWRPEVSLAAINGAADPLTAYLQMRQQLRANVDKQIALTTIRAYDGKRLTEYAVKAVQRSPIFLGEKRINAIHTGIRRTGIDGYTPKEWKKLKKNNPVIYAKFRDDATMQLLKAEFSAGFGLVSLELVEGEE